MKGEKGDKGELGLNGKDGVGLTVGQQRLISKLPGVINGFAGLPLLVQIIIPLTIIVISAMISLLLLGVAR